MRRYHVIVVFTNGDTNTYQFEAEGSKEAATMVMADLCNKQPDQEILTMSVYVDDKEVTTTRYIKKDDVEYTTNYKIEKRNGQIAIMDDDLVYDIYKTEEEAIAALKSLELTSIFEQIADEEIKGAWDTLYVIGRERGLSAEEVRRIIRMYMS